MDIVPESFQVHFFDPEKSFSHEFDDLRRSSVHGILIRTVTKIDPHNFESALFPNLMFIGTASAGIDHVDVDYLKKISVHFSSAGGCNANAVGEYVATGILHWSLSNNLNLDSLRVGIIGVGNTGSSVYDKLKGLGCKCALYDPPRSNRDDKFVSASLSEILDCDILTFHVPLTKNNDSKYPTLHWLNDEKLSKFDGKLIVNASRGEVVDEKALINWKTRSSKSKDFILDVWDSEPDINVELAKKSWLATPHIAGYSNQSKWNATHMIVDELSRFFDVPQENVIFVDFITDNTNPENSKTDFDTKNSSDINEIATLENLHPMFHLNEKLKSGISDSKDANIKLFRTLRTHSKLRNEFKSLSVDQIQTFEQFSNVYKLLMVAKGIQ